MIILKVGVKYSVVNQLPITNCQLLIELWSVIGIGIGIGGLEETEKSYAQNTLKARRNLLCLS